MSVPSHRDWVDKQIREATERGEFDNLPGAGKPLRGLEDRDPDWWVKKMMDREGLDAADALPPVMQLRREGAGYPQSLVGQTREDNVRELLRDFNARVLDERRRPVLGRYSPPVVPTVDVEEMVARWRELRTERARAGAMTAPTEPVAPPSRRSWWRRLLGR
ncbi:DUF1992 domain-containing protein [Janibacter alittae]|uniref:DUF1992 domain-containing protein n=1 Tax=Janibacter alittae TaxID=3115209 RepID=A0ABZ2MF90_9MICO